MYMQNSWRAPVPPQDPNEMNFVKPPMVDREGMIMWPNFVNMFGDRNTFCQHREQGPPITHSLVNLQPQDNLANGQHFIDFSRFPNRDIVQGGVAQPIRNIYTGNYIHTASRYDAFCSQSAAPGTLASYTFDNRLDNTYVTWPSTLRPEPEMNNLIRQQQEENLKNYRLQDYLMFLSNVKNIPIGVGPAKSYIAANEGEPALLPPTGDCGNNPKQHTPAEILQWKMLPIERSIPEYKKANFRCMQFFRSFLACWVVGPKKHFRLCSLVLAVSISKSNGPNLCRLDNSV